MAEYLWGGDGVFHRLSQLGIQILCQSHAVGLNPRVLCLSSRRDLPALLHGAGHRWHRGAEEHGSVLHSSAGHVTAGHRKVMQGLDLALARSLGFSHRSSW